MHRLLSSFLILPLMSILLIVPSFGATSRTASRTVATATDSQIEATIRTKLAKSKIGQDGFKFTVQKGVVTWQGTTNVMQHKGSATRMARTAGAVQVVNNIQISGAGKAKAFGEMKKAYVK